MRTLIRILSELRPGIMAFLVWLATRLGNPWVLYPMIAWSLFLTCWLYNRHMMDKWDEAGFADADIGPGEYRVVMLPRWLFFWFRNVKEIQDGGHCKVGNNLAYGRFPWARFRAWMISPEEAQLFKRGHKTAILCLDYSLSRFPFKMIRDHVREVKPGVFLGRFMVQIRGRLFFLCWFKLIGRQRAVYVKNRSYRATFPRRSNPPGCGHK